jgi:FkbM family methyltransferase
MIVHISRFISSLVNWPKLWLKKMVANEYSFFTESAFTAVFAFFQSFDNRTLRRSRFEALALKNNYAFADQGVEKFIVFTSDKEISKSVYVNGDFDFAKVIKAIKLLGGQFKLDILIDVGANIGTICIPAVNRKIATKAIAFEPDPNNYRILVSNIHLNNLSENIEYYNLALGAESNQLLSLEMSENNSGDHRIRVSTEDGIYAEASRNVIRVKSEKFDSLVKRLDKRTSLIWMDTQGYEGFILQGASNAIEAQIPIVLEFWPYGIKRAGSYELLKSSILRYQWFYDLSEEDPKAMSTNSIDELYHILGETGDFTDIMLIS